jgi:hypothetical protein
MTFTGEGSWYPQHSDDIVNINRTRDTFQGLVGALMGLCA